MSAPGELHDAAEGHDKNSSHFRVLRVCCWLFALALGAIGAWASRFTMNPDGVSYLDIGDAYLRGDWHNALNGYWSPLYSWALGVAMKIVKPSAYWEYPLAHVVNFLIYTAALASFEFFLATFIRDRKRRDQELQGQGLTGLPESAWWLLGYSLFISCSLLLIGLAWVTPDMCVAAFVFLASALLIKIRAGNPGVGTYIAFGVALGFAYLAKAVMFPLGLTYLAMAFISSGRNPNKLHKAAFSAMALLAVAGPFIFLLSRLQGRFTFSEVGSIAYEVYVDGVDQFVPHGKGLLHPVRQILHSPATYEFGEPVSGTYPLWYDSAYWHAGLKPVFSSKGQRTVLLYGLSVYFTILTSVHLAIGVALLSMISISPDPIACCRAISRAWPILIPSLVALILYWIVYTEFRYVAPFVVLLWFSAFSGLAYPNSERSKRFLTIAVIAIAATTLIFQSISAAYAIKFGLKAKPTYWQAAQALSEFGIRPGDTLAVIGPQPFGDGGTFVARLIRNRIVAQTSTQDTSWVADQLACSQLIAALSKVGVKALIRHGEPQNNSAISWDRVDSTDYYVSILHPNLVSRH